MQREKLCLRILANGSMNAQTATRCYGQKLEIVAYFVHMGQFHARPYRVKTQQVAPVVPTLEYCD